MKATNSIDTREVYAWIVGACHCDTHRVTCKPGKLYEYIQHMYTVVCEYLIEGTASQGPWEDYEHDLCMRAKRLFK